MTKTSQAVAIAGAALVGLAAGVVLVPIASRALTSMRVDPVSMCTRPEVRQFVDADLVRRTDLSGGMFDHDHSLAADWDSALARVDPTRPKVYRCVVVAHGYISAGFQSRFATAETRDNMRGAITVDPDTWRVALGEAYIVTDTGDGLGIRAGW